MTGLAAMPTDILVFGDEASERAHLVTAETSDVIRGGLGQPARRLLPLKPGPGNTPGNTDEWRGGSVAFQLKVEGGRQNYLTVRLWGSDDSANRATLYCDGKQVGYRQLSDIDILDQGTHGKVKPGHFHYVTHPLPVALTAGKSRISCHIRATGPIWRYGGDIAKFQRAMTEPSRGFYALAVHADKMAPSFGDDGRPAPYPINPSTSPEVLTRVKARVNDQIKQLWRLRGRAPHQMEISFLAKTYETEWTDGYHRPETVAAILAGADAYYARFLANPDIALNDVNTPNPGWFGFGLLGEALKIVGPHIQTELDQPLTGPGGHPIRRRDAYEAMFLHSLDWNRKHRRLYTNQSMIKDLYGIWNNNEGLIAIGSARAEPRDRLLPFFYESIGLRPWTGSLNDKGEPTYAAAEGDARFSVPKNYFETTRKGLTKELGYVGGYGEVLDWVAEIYDATRPARGQAGDAMIRDQLVKLAQARAVFRIPHADGDGFRSMRLETGIGWRDMHYPGDVIYGQRPSWDASPLQVAVATQDPKLIAYAQQQMADNQLFPSIEHMMTTKTLRATIGLIDVIEDYETLRRLPPQPYRLPMSEGQPDFVFTDEENGVVAVKNGGDILYASLYWRANYAISGVGRVHYITPETDRIATVALDRQEFEPSGLYFTRPNNPHINGMRFTVKYPDDGDVWTAGEQNPVAKLPEGTQYIPGEDSPYAGRADFYQLTYGPYLIAINASAAKSFDVALPARTQPVKELVTGAVVPPAIPALALKPGTTAVIFLGDEK
ncbi:MULTISPECIES: hypothetical protein [Asticcacaulis]|uniref:hypothetical protein n=1 Tax=Asticcacaulis TaxID=76890 RepID=UPI001AEA3DB7|nr:MULTISPECIES: hypothetical protein [Asticcacaulis]MBP2157889.1 hypothetical protein [Asticcacaulis solisilvae]MDR6798934.1 hypothetical protein [Asticcacaulis sp. BE141]